jgi:hypothetical protein
MFKLTYLFGAVLLLTCFASQSAAQEVVKRKPDESLKQFALRIIAPQTALAHDVLEGAFAASAKNLVVLYTPVEAQSSAFLGMVLTPAANGEYRKFALPIEADLSGRFEVNVQAVFYANADKDAQLELVILYSTYRNGSGEKDWGEAYVFDWDGKEFVSLENIELKLSGLRTAQAVRKKLKSLGY